MSETDREPRASRDDGEGVTASTEGSLPAVTNVRPHADGGEAVVVTFGNGARLRYRERGECVVEVWESPDGERVTRERQADWGREAAALRSLAAYLSFGSRERAAFVWGPENVATLLG